MDNVKYSFAEKIKQSLHSLTNPGCSNSVTTNEKGVTPTPTFRDSEKQKSILMKYFEKGEQTGIKRTPQQVISAKINSYKANKAYQNESK